MFAGAKESPHLYATFKAAAKGKILPESYGYFFRQVKKRFMRWLETNENDWRSWPEKSKAYLQARGKNTEKEEFPPETDQSETISVPVIQARLPFC